MSSGYDAVFPGKYNKEKSAVLGLLGHVNTSYKLPINVSKHLPNIFNVHRTVHC